MNNCSTGKIVLLLFASVLLSLSLKAQCTIKGRVTDSLNAAVPFAAVGVMNAKDTSLVKGIITNDSGAFSITNIKPGNYILKVVATGYPLQYSSAINATDGVNNVPAIQLKNSGTALKGVRVSADKPFREQQAGKTIFNVDNSIISAGKNALEMLNDLPGVSADDNANISVNGKGSVLVLVDDKPILTDLATYLKTIDASQIEKVEVITNPSARYQASGHVVINIVLKKDKNMGLNGEIIANYKQGYYAGGNFDLNLDYRTKKWNFFINSGTNLFHNNVMRSSTEVFNEGTPEQLTLSEINPFAPQGLSAFGSGGIDFTPDKRQTISYTFEGNMFPVANHVTTNDNTIFTNNTGAVDSSASSPTTRIFKETDVTNQLTYDFKIDTDGRELSANVGYLPYVSTNTQQLPVYYYNSEGEGMRPSTLSTSNETSAINVWNAQVDYTQPLNKNSKLEIGLYTQHARSDNNAQFWNVIQGEQVVDTTRSNHFIFSEDISAGYVNYYRRLSEKFDFEVGVRAEQTNDKGTQYVHDTTFTRNYFGLFPSGTINWKINKNNTLTVSYSRRVDRPDYDQLNPFLNQVSPYNYISGNIGLLPTFSNNYEIDYSFMGALNLTLGYINFTNIESFGFTQNDSTHITYSSPINTGLYNAYYAALSISLPVTQWWTTDNTFYPYHDDYIGNYNGSSYNKTQLSFQFKTLNMFNFKRGWRFQALFQYESLNRNNLTLEPPHCNLDLGISKRFDNDRFTLSFNCSDIFMTSTHIVIQQYDGVDITSKEYDDIRKLRINLVWKFGKSQYQREENAKKQNLQVGKGKI